MNDRYSYITPSKVKCLLVPVNGCTQSNFIKYLDAISSDVNEVRLMDVSPNSSLHYFNPQTFPNGRILYDFVTTSPDSESIFLHDFEPFRKTFIIIGIGKYNTDFDLKSSLNSLKKLYPSSIVHNLILFDTPEDKIVKNPSHDNEMFLHGGIIDRNITSIESIMCDVSYNFLFSLDSYASSFANITLRSPVSITDSHTLTKTIYQAQKRLSSGSTSFKASFSNSSSNSPTATDTKSKSQQRHNGRQSKLMGNFYLLAGKYNLALQYFTEAMTNLKKAEDFLWLGSALEGISISTLLLQYIGQSYQLSTQAVCGVLQISKSKLHSLTSSSFSHSNNATPRSSADNISSPPPSTISTNGQSSRPLPNPAGIGHNRNSSHHSPRNSTSSNLSSNFTTAPDSALPLPIFIRLVSSKVLHYYNLSTNDYENMVPDIVYVESTLRTIKYMISIFLSGESLDSRILDSIVKSTKVVTGSSGGHDIGHFLKSDILEEIEKIFSLQLVDMSITEQCRIYCCLASMYTDLKLYRKRAFILRTLMAEVLPRLDINSLIQKSDVADISCSINSLTGTGDRTTNFRDIFEYLLSIYQITSESESDAQSAYDHSQGNWTAVQILVIKLCMKICESMKDWSFLLKLCGILLTRFTHCLSPDDQTKLKEKIDSLIYLSNRNNLNLSTPYWDPFLVRRVKFINHRHKDELISFTEYEQNNKSISFDDASGSKSRVTSGSGVTGTSEPVIFNPYNKVKNTSINRDKLLIKDDIYQIKVQLQNPFAFEVEINYLNIVTEGEVQVQTLKNNIKALGQVINYSTVNNTKVAFNPKGRPGPNIPIRKVTFSSANSITPASSSNGTMNVSHPLIIPPNSSEQFLVAFKPLNDGELHIVGFIISLSNCEEQYFRIVDQELFKQKLKVDSKKDLSSKKNLDIEKVNENLYNSNILARVLTKKLSLMVIPPQPSLSLTNILVTNGWIMLLEGEKIPFSISLTNHSDELINFLSFSFWDSTIDVLNKKLIASSGAGGQLLPASEIYEIEWYLLKFKPFKILNKNLIAKKYEKILPKSDITIDYEITAKRGIKELKIILEYAHKQADLSKSFIKYVQVPLNLSIMPSLEIVGCDILPLFSSSLQGFEGSEISNGGNLGHGNLEKVLKFITSIINSPDKDIADYCLLIIDLRNSWNEKLCSTLGCVIDEQNKNGQNDSFEVEDYIEPSKTYRFLLPLRRICDQDIDVKKPIPSLRNKQFVKNYSISESEEMKMRELFWLRSILLENLQGRWNTIGGSNVRTGNIELRNIRLTNKMANILIYNPIRLSSSIYLDSDPNHPIKKTGTQYSLKTEEFYFLRTTITNNSSNSINGILRHLPFPTSVLSSLSTNNPNYAQMSIDKRILINGVLQNHLGEDGIAPGGEICVDLSLVILERGEYEWGCVLDVLNKDNLQVVEREPIFINAE